MYQEALEIDRNLTAVANWGFHSHFLDVVLSVLTGNGLWAVLFLSYGCWILYKKKWRGLTAILALIVLFALTDFIAYEVLKPYFGRIRPCKVLPWVRVYSEVGCAGWQSFPSNHATNGAALLTWLSFHANSKVILVASLLVGMVGFSRIYFGVHYPIDVIGGYFVGFCVALLVVGCQHLIISSLRWFTHTHIRHRKDLK